MVKGENENNEHAGSVLLKTALERADMAGGDICLAP